MIDRYELLETGSRCSPEEIKSVVGDWVKWEDVEGLLELPKLTAEDMTEIRRCHGSYEKEARILNFILKHRAEE